MLKIDPGFSIVDPIFPLVFLINSWIPGMFDVVFQTTFIATLMLFWLCLYHGIRQVRLWFQFHFCILFSFCVIFVKQLNFNFTFIYQLSLGSVLCTCWVSASVLFIYWFSASISFLFSVSVRFNFTLVHTFYFWFEMLSYHYPPVWYSRFLFEMHETS